MAYVMGVMAVRALRRIAGVPAKPPKAKSRGRLLVQSLGTALVTGVLAGGLVGLLPVATKWMIRGAVIAAGVGQLRELVSGRLRIRPALRLLGFAVGSGVFARRPLPTGSIPVPAVGLPGRLPLGGGNERRTGGALPWFITRGR